MIDKEDKDLKKLAEAIGNVLGTILSFIVFAGAICLAIGAFVGIIVFFQWVSTKLDIWRDAEYWASFAKELKGTGIRQIQIVPTKPR